MRGWTGRIIVGLALGLVSTFAISGRAETARTLSLAECLQLARANNERAAISEVELQAARAMVKQAMSGYWPTLSASAKATRMDEDPIFTFPASTFVVPPMDVNVPSMNIRVPAMNFAVPSMNFTVPGQMIGPIPVPPQNITVPGQNLKVPSQNFRTPSSSIRVPGQSFEVPEQKIKIMDRDNLILGLNATLPVFTAGLRPAMIEQARAGVDAAQEMVRRTEADIIYDTRHFYYGAVTARQLVKTAQDTLERMEATLDLTERMFNTGSGTVKKTDFLRNRTVVEILRSAVAEAENKKAAACAALGFAIGEGWENAVEPKDEAVPFRPVVDDIAALIQNAQANSPEVARAEAGLRAARAKVKEARSGHWPKVGLLASANRIENDYDKGAVDDENVNNWLIGVGAELPLFEGFRVKNKVNEAAQLMERGKLYRDLAADGVALQIQLAWQDAVRAAKQEGNARAGLEAARENRELNVRAYQDELVETKDVIEAQLMEAFLEAQYYKVVLDHDTAAARLDQIAGGP